MYHRKDRKKELARRALVYALMTLSMVGLVVLLMFNLLGYRFDPFTRTVAQTGLVHYDSFPRGAMAAVDGADVDTTHTKNTVLPGQRQFTVKLKGYEPWQKSLEIKPGTVTHLDYIRLVPTMRRISDIRTMSGVDGALFSPGGRYVAILRTVHDKPLLSWGDMRDIATAQFVDQPLDTTQLTGYESPTTKHALTLHEWDDSERYLLLKHQYTPEGQPTATQWLLLDRDKPATLLDVSKKAGLALTDIHLVSGNEAYALQANGAVRHIQLDQPTISGPLLTGVASFSLYNRDTLAFRGRQADVSVLGFWKKDWPAPQIIRRLTQNEADQPLQIRVSRYFGRDTVAIGIGDTVTMYRGALPSSSNELARFRASERRFSLGRPITDVSFSPNGRFVLARDAAGFMSYDLERATVSQEVKLDNQPRLEWLDGFHVWHANAAGMAVMQEFDGMNPHQLVSAVPALDLSLSADGKAVYFWQRTVDGLAVLKKLAMTTS